MWSTFNDICIGSSWSFPKGIPDWFTRAYKPKNRDVNIVQANGRKVVTMSPCSSQKMQLWTFQSGRIWTGFSGADPLYLRAARLHLYLKAIQVRIKKPKGQVALQNLYTSKQSFSSASLNHGGLMQGADGEPVQLYTLTRARTKPLLDVHESPEGSLHYQKPSTTKSVLQKLHKHGLLFTWLASLCKSLGMKAALKYMKGHERCFLFLFIFIFCGGAY